MTTPWNGRLQEFINNPSYSTKTNYRQRIIEEIERRIEPGSSDWLLDYGCGIGTLKRYLSPSIKYIGTDFTPEFIEYCNDTYKDETTEFHTVTTPDDCLEFIGDRNITLVNATSVINHCHNWEEILQGLTRLSRKYIVLLQPTSEKTELLMTTEFGVPLYRISATDISAALAANHFDTEVVDHIDYVGPKGGITPCALVIGKKQ